MPKNGRLIFCESSCSTALESLLFFAYWRKEGEGSGGWFGRKYEWVGQMALKSSKLAENKPQMGFV